MYYFDLLSRIVYFVETCLFLELLNCSFFQWVSVKMSLLNVYTTQVPSMRTIEQSVISTFLKKKTFSSFGRFSFQSCT